MTGLKSNLCECHKEQGMGKPVPSFGQHASGIHRECLHSRGIVWEQGFWKVSSDTKRTGGSATDQMTSLFQPRTFVKKCFAFLFPLAKSFPFRLLASFPHPIGRDCSTEKEGGSNREFAELETDQRPQSPARVRAIHWKHTSACECKPTFLHSLPLA